MRVGEKVLCIFCLNSEPSLELRIDKLSRPYLYCSGGSKGCGCGVRVFLRGPQSMKGLELLFNAVVIAAHQEEEPREVAQALLKRAVQRSEDEESNISSNR